MGIEESITGDFMKNEKQVIEYVKWMLNVWTKDKVYYRNNLNACEIGSQKYDYYSAKFERCDVVVTELTELLEIMNGQSR